MSLSPGNSTSVNKDKSLTLTCSVTLNLDSGWTYKLQWVFKGKVIVSDKSKYTISEIPDEAANETSSLTINNMNSEDSGTYTCQADINIGSKTTKSKFSKSVDVTGKDVFVNINFHNYIKKPKRLSIVLPLIFLYIQCALILFCANKFI